MSLARNDLHEQAKKLESAIQSLIKNILAENKENYINEQDKELANNQLAELTGINSYKLKRICTLEEMNVLLAYCTAFNTYVEMKNAKEAEIKASEKDLNLSNQEATRSALNQKLIDQKQEIEKTAAAVSKAIPSMATRCVCNIGVNACRLSLLLLGMTTPVVSITLGYAISIGAVASIAIGAPIVGIAAIIAVCLVGLALAWLINKLKNHLSTKSENADKKFPFFSAVRKTYEFVDSKPSETNKNDSQTESLSSKTSANSEETQPLLVSTTSADGSQFINDGKTPTVPLTLINLNTPSSSVRVA